MDVLTRIIRDFDGWRLPEQRGGAMIATGSTTKVRTAESTSATEHIDAHCYPRHRDL
jgi:hypothetical protein